jgi:hypothetical protein
MRKFRRNRVGGERHDAPVTAPEPGGKSSRVPEPVLLLLDADNLTVRGESVPERSGRALGAECEARRDVFGLRAA